MMTDQDRQWLTSAYPALTSNSGTLSGVLEFTATYNDKNHQFLILNGGAADTVGGRRLEGRFEIRIQDRPDKSVSVLAALYVEGLDPIPDRHFNQSDKSACLCSPLEEQGFLTPDLEFRLFFEQLIIPFLYGQVFYSAEGRWPWFEYGHGAVGLLESYSRIGEVARAQDCVRRLANDKDAWARIRRALKSKEAVKGGTACFCPRADQIRRCHPLAWRGIRQLKHDLSNQGVLVP